MSSFLYVTDYKYFSGFSGTFYTRRVASPILGSQVVK
jgi:hypothetical protein